MVQYESGTNMYISINEDEEETNTSFDNPHDWLYVRWLCCWHLKTKKDVQNLIIIIYK